MRLIYIRHMSRRMGKQTICIGENKDADQLRGNREADQRLCFRYSDSTIPLLLKSERGTCINRVFWPTQKPKNMYDTLSYMF